MKRFFALLVAALAFRRAVSTPKSEAVRWRAVRDERDVRLAACDWVAARAADRNEPMPEEWRIYRQALRDVTLKADPSEIEWPVAPPD